MKKLVLKSGIREMLSKTQMKQIIGGSTCNARCYNGTEISCEGANCYSEDYQNSIDGYLGIQDGYCTKESGGEYETTYCSEP